MGGDSKIELLREGSKTKKESNRGFYPLKAKSLKRGGGARRGNN